MSGMQKIVLITGAVTSGKTSLLSVLADKFSSRLQVDGFLAKAPERTHGSGQFADKYVLCRIGRPETLSWATARSGNNGYDFNPVTQNFLDNRFAGHLAVTCPDVLVLDELGRLELGGAGLEQILISALSSDIKMLVCTVKKRCLNEILEKYHLQESICVDLDLMDRHRAIEKITEYLDFPMTPDT
jgi:nucleoside-triphosphatase THEP1